MAAMMVVCAVACASLCLYGVLERIVPEEFVDKLLHILDVE